MAAKVKKIGRKKIPDSAIIIAQLDKHEWSFEYPRIPFEAHEEFDYAIDIWHAGDLREAEKRFKELIKKYPEFIDVHHHYALLLQKSGEPYKAFEIWQDIVQFCLSLLPDNFYFGRDLLPWLSIDNRPFLRAYHSLALDYAWINETEKALNIYNNILDMNPGDNQGVRALAIGCYFQLKRPGNVLQITEKFPADGLAETIYGEVLALFQLDYAVKAKKKLKEAYAFLPLVAEEIAKKQHRRPKNTYPGSYSFGGADQAYYYWLENGKYWKSTSGAIDFVNSIIHPGKDE